MPRVREPWMRMLLDDVNVAIALDAESCEPSVTSRIVTVITEPKKGKSRCSDSDIRNRHAIRRAPSKGLCNIRFKHEVEDIANVPAVHRCKRILVVKSGGNGPSCCLKQAPAHKRKCEHRKRQ